MQKRLRTMSKKKKTYVKRELEEVSVGNPLNQSGSHLITEDWKSFLCLGADVVLRISRYKRNRNFNMSLSDRTVSFNFEVE